MEHASKLALTVACGTEYSAPVISRDVAAWSVAVVEHVTETLVDAVRDSVSSTDYGRDELKILRCISRAGPDGVTLTDIGCRVKGMHPQQRKSILNDLIERREIGMKMGSGGARGPASAIYYPIRQNNYHEKQLPPGPVSGSGPPTPIYRARA
jgi:hypothetical protein